MVLELNEALTNWNLHPRKKTDRKFSPENRQAKQKIPKRKEAPITTMFSARNLLSVLPFFEKKYLKIQITTQRPFFK